MIIEKTYNTKTRNLYKKVGFIDELYIRESKPNNYLSEIQINLRIVDSVEIIKIYKKDFKDILEKEFNHLYIETDTGKSSYKVTKDSGKYFVVWMIKVNGKYLLYSENGRSIYRHNFKNSLITHLNLYSHIWVNFLLGPGFIIYALFGINFWYFVIIGIILFYISRSKIKQLV